MSLCFGKSEVITKLHWFFYILNVSHLVNATLFLRSDDRSVVECVWNGFILTVNNI